MRDYGRVYTAFWTNHDMRAVSDDARLLAIYLLTSPHTTLIGAFRLPDGYVAEDLKWSSERVSKGLGELSRIGFATRCEVTKWVWIRAFLSWNTPENPNQWKAARKLLDQIPDVCAWHADFIGVFREAGGNLPPSDTAINEPFQNPSRTLSKSGSGSGSGSGSQNSLSLKKADAPVSRETEPAQPQRVATAVEAAYGQLLDDWRRDIPEVNSTAFQRWIVHCELAGKQMTPGMRLAQAKRLAGMGSDPDQAEVVEWCCEQGYKTLVPLADVRARRDGRHAATTSSEPIRTWEPPDDEPETTRAQA